MPEIITEYTARLLSATSRNQHTPNFFSVGGGCVEELNGLWKHEYREAHIDDGGVV